MADCCCVPVYADTWAKSELYYRCFVGLLYFFNTQRLLHFFQKEKTFQAELTGEYYGLSANIARY